MTIVFKGTVLEIGSRQTTMTLLQQMQYAVSKWHADGCPASGDKE